MVGDKPITASGTEPPGSLDVPSDSSLNTPPPGPLELPGWLEFSQWRTRCVPRVISSATEASSARMVLYLDKRGRVVLPRGNPYLPIRVSANGRRLDQQIRAGHRAVEPLVEEVRSRGSANQLYLSPDADDVRPWLWRGFFVSVRYTLVVDFPFDPARLGAKTRRRHQTALKRGYSAQRVDDVKLVRSCLEETENRQGFAYGLRTPELSEARRLMGDDAFRMYVSFDARGRPASTAIMLHAPGSLAIGWALGTRADALPDGATYVSVMAAIDDLTVAGASGLDFCGANIASVSEFKSQFSTRLVPNFGIRTYSPRTAARFMLDWRSSGRRRSEPSERGVRR